MAQKQIDTYGIKNVNFSLIEKDDERWDEFQKQRFERGFDDSELWSLDYTIARFIAPRIKAFSKNLVSYPCGMTSDEWDEILKTMINAFELISDDEDAWIGNKELEDAVNLGLDNFRKYFFNLWD